MGWKSTITITREEAISAINKVARSFDELTNTELKNLMYSLDIGDNTDLPYFGHNFYIVDTKEETIYA